MSDDNRQDNKSNGGTWLIAAGTLALGYYIGLDAGSTSAERSYAASQPLETYAPGSDTTLDTPEIVETADTDSGSEEGLQASDSDTDAQDDTDTDTDYQQFAYSPSTTATEPEDDTPAAVSSAETTSPSNQAVLAAGTGASVATGPWSRYPSTSATTTYTPPRSYPTYVAPSTSSAGSKCEGVGCYGAISTTTGLPRTNYVSGYTRKDGTYVRPYYRSRRR